MWQGNQNRGHRQSSLYGMHKMCRTTHLFNVLRSKKHIRDNTICQFTVARIYRVTPECSARESCDIGIQNRGHRQSSLYGMHKMCRTTHLFNVLRSKKHIRDNTICQFTVARIYRVTPECSARESCDIGIFFSLPTARAFA